VPKSGSVAPTFSDTIICERMGWTYDELQETPEYFIDALVARWAVEQKYQEEEQKKLKERIKFPKKARA